MLRSKCPSGQRFDTIQKKCVIMCNPGETYYPQSDSCSTCPIGQEDDINRGCVSKCKEGDLSCLGACYSENQYRCGCITKDNKLDETCSYPDLISLGRICKDGTICKEDEECSSGTCKKCSNPCGGVCCAVGDECSNSGCCQKGFVRDDGSCCSDDRWIESKQICCPLGWTKVGESCGCGTVACENTTDYTCVSYQDENGQQFYCKNKSCEFDSPTNYYPSIQGVCQNEDGMLLYCNSDKKVAGGGAQRKGPATEQDSNPLKCDYTQGDNFFCRSADVSEKSVNKCSTGDCVKFFQTDGVTSVNFSNGDCSALFACDKKCSPDVLRPSGIPDYRFCRDDNGNDTGKFCDKGTCNSNGKCVFYECDGFGKCNETDDSSKFEVCGDNCKLPEGWIPVRIQHINNGNSLYLRVGDNGESQLVEDNLDDPNQIFYRVDTEDSTGSCDVNHYWPATWFYIKNRDGKCLDGGENISLGGKWKWADCNTTNDWFKYVDTRTNFYGDAITTKQNPACNNEPTQGLQLDSGGDNKDPYFSNKPNATNVNQISWHIVPIKNNQT